MCRRSRSFLRLVISGAALISVVLAECGAPGPTGGDVGPQRAREIAIAVGTDEGTLTPYTQQSRN